MLNKIPSWLWRLWQIDQKHVNDFNQSRTRIFLRLMKIVYCTAIISHLKLNFTSDVPASPVSVKIEHITSRMIILQWNQPALDIGESNILRYVVQYTHLQSKLSNETVTSTLKSPQSGLEIGSLQPYSNYSVCIRGESAVGISLWSETNYFRTDSEGNILLIMFYFIFVLYTLKFT